MRKLFFLGILLFCAIITQAQWKLSGKITDQANNETLIGANVLIGQGQGTVTDFNGYFEIKLPNGKYEVTISYVGYRPVKIPVEIKGKNFLLDVALESEVELDEVKIVADVARSRETPVAFSTITPQRLEEVLGAQDIPILLNSTPGVYSTTEGGGDGDAQVTIRGFSARNVGVLLDGVPVNDMENGHVYWSNWFGLDAVTRSIQVQRGLGASKLALPSVGGTINIITKGFENKKEGNITQEVGSDGFIRTSFGYSSGVVGNNWAITAAGSFKRSNGWVDQAWSKGFFYYLKVDKRIGSHTVSLSGYGAPQSHGQRSYRLKIPSYSSEVARELGVPEELISKTTARGFKYNQHWGYLAQTKENPNAKAEPYNERVNEYHKPQFTLKDSWVITDRLFISNILYASIGNGGGVRSKNTISSFDENGQMNFQGIYDQNISENSIYPTFDSTLHWSGNYMRRLVNSHRWYGFISTVNYEIDDHLTFAGGIDIRTYKGIHYEEVYDLLGGDYTLWDYASANWDENNLQSLMLYEGDKNNFHYDGLVRWGGLFGQLEYKKNKFSGFINLTTANTGYQRVDYMRMREAFNVPERVGYTYKMQDGGKVETTSWKWFPGFTAKTGANFNFTSNMNAFINVGFLNRAPRFNNVFDYENTLFIGIENETVKSAELGWSYSTPKFTTNLNTYYTIWGNKPVDAASTYIDPLTQNEYSVNVNGLDALHKGIELDFVYILTRNLKIQGVVSLGDWRWNSSDTVRIYDDNQNLVKAQFIDAKGVHVGNTAQTQIAGEIRWEPIRGLYFTPRFTFFDDYYSDFEALSLDGKTSSYTWYDPETGEHGPVRDSWKIPSYVTVDFHTGYNFKVKNNRVQVRLNIMNAFNNIQITSAQNNDTYNAPILKDFDAKSAAVFFGQGRMYNMSLKYIF